MKRIKNQAGITLIELLAALVIGTIVIGLAGSVLVSTFTQADVTSDHASLRQEANIILTKIRSDYSNADESTTLSFDNTENMLFDRNSAPLSEEDFFKFSSFTFTEVRPDGETANEFSYTEGHTPSPSEITFEKGTENRGNRLKVEFTIEDTNGRSFSVDTTIARLGDYEDYQTGTEEEQISDDTEEIISQNVSVFTSRLDFGGDLIDAPDYTGVFNDLVVTDDFNQGATLGFSNLIFNQGISLQTGSLQLGSSSTPGDIIVYGNAEFNGGTRNIYGTSYIYGDLSIQNANIHGDIFVEGNVNATSGVPQFHNGSNIYFTGELLTPSDYPTTNFIKVESIEQKERTITQTPQMHPDEWYSNKGYETTAPENRLRDAPVKHFFVDDFNINTNPQVSVDGLVVISKGDISFSTFGGQDLTNAFLFAPNGTISFNGEKFSGVMISGEGIDMPRGGIDVEFMSINDLFNRESDIPIR
ncbi:PulJ/GspJ family protein [Salisediminibacterium selenitireducens]|uniref:Prepilin-type N-terminal cleavage/methylation domain-containing protein n=1 Tax=Bacillus selenitireducens (strain ATCC 700615 / DSM 15326 / MLS10) TaxID=439292 RepID=D6Y0C8_BACIE|nr:prepilin-type N-terminal cleavage/methylation domain-containing protein [Salisediminibacterium selenitireducens]ADH98519.1 hypothetical protein Bsel_0998 [[Bacillus] selenitireducens MLS10]